MKQFNIDMGTYSYISGFICIFTYIYAHWMLEYNFISILSHRFMLNIRQKVKMFLKVKCFLSLS